MLIINVIKLIIDPSKIPVEFSAITYFTTPLVILLKLKKFQVWTVYSSLMAGIFYYLTMMSGGSQIYELYAPANIYTALLCHGALLFIGIVKIRTVVYNKNHSYKLIIGIILILIWSLYMRTQVVFTERLFIYELIDASFVRNLGYSSPLIIIGYYVVLSSLIFISFKLLFFFNKISNRNYQKRYGFIKVQTSSLDVSKSNKFNYT
ncbi:hypothetical protein RJI07_03535 [Mycoplasmatota bacterium WC30]